MHNDEPRLTVDPRFRGLEDAAALEALGDRLFSGDAMAHQQDALPQHPMAAPNVGQMGGEIEAVKRDALHQARQHASKARRSVMSEAVMRAEREVELKRMEEELEAEDRQRVVDEHAQLRDSLHDDARKQRIDDTTKRALKQLQQLSDFLNLDKADPQLERVSTLSATGPPLSLEKEIQRRMVPHQLRPSDMFRSNLRAMDHLMEAVAAIQAPTIAQLEDEERELMLEAAHDAEATKILMAECTCAARLDNAIRSAETAAAIKARMECTHLFAKMTVAAANMIRTLEMLVSEKDTYIDDVTASNQMLVKKYDALLDDFYVMERDTSQRLKELEEELKKPIGGAKSGGLHAASGGAAAGGSRTPRGGHAALPPAASQFAPPPTKASQAVALGKHSIVLKQREFLEREGRVLHRYRTMFEVRPEDNPCPVGASGLQCGPSGGLSSPPLLHTTNNNSSFHNNRSIGASAASFRIPHDDLAAAAMTSSNTTQPPQPSEAGFNQVLTETFRLDAHMKPEDKTSNAEWVRCMMQRVQRFQAQKQHSRDLEKQLMAMHDVAEAPASVSRAMQTLKEEDVVGSPAWEKKYSAMREAAERALRPALQDDPQTREMFHTDFMIKQELRKCGIDAMHGIPQRIIGPLEAVMGAIKDMLVSVDYARVTTVQQLSRDVKDEVRAMQRCNKLQAELEDELEDGLENLRRGLANFKGSVLESLRPVMVTSSSPTASPTNETSAVFGCSNVDLLSRLSNRFATWARDVLHMQLPDMSAFGQDGADGPPDPVRQSIRSLDILFDMVSELSLENGSGTAMPLTTATSPHRKSKKRIGDDDDPQESEEQATRSMVGSSVGIAMLDATELIQSIRAALPITLPVKVQDALGSPPPETWQEWGSVVSHLRMLSEWCKSTGAGVEKYRREAAAAKIAQAENDALPPLLATPRKSTAAVSSPSVSLTDEATLSKSKRSKAKTGADDSPSPVAKRSSSKAAGARSGGGMGQSIRHTTSPKEDAGLFAGGGTDAPDMPPPPAPEPQPSLWEEKENPLAANVQMLAMSIRDIIFRLTNAISKTQYRAAKIPSATMREVLLLDKELAEEQNKTAWSTEKLALLIGRVVDWSDMVGDIVALPYERTTSDSGLGIRNLDEEATEAAKVVGKVPSVFSLREKHKRTLSNDSGVGDGNSSGHASSQVSQRVGPAGGSAAAASSDGMGRAVSPTREAVDERPPVQSAAVCAGVSPTSVSFLVLGATSTRTTSETPGGSTVGGVSGWGTTGDTPFHRHPESARSAPDTRSPVPEEACTTPRRESDVAGLLVQPSDWVPLHTDHHHHHAAEPTCAAGIRQTTFMDAILDATTAAAAADGTAEPAAVAASGTTDNASPDDHAVEGTEILVATDNSNGGGLDDCSACATIAAVDPVAHANNIATIASNDGAHVAIQTASSEPGAEEEADAPAEDCTTVCAAGVAGLPPDAAAIDDGLNRNVLAASEIKIPTANPRAEGSSQQNTAVAARRTVSPRKGDVLPRSAVPEPADATTSRRTSSSSKELFAATTMAMPAPQSSVQPQLPLIPTPAAAKQAIATTPTTSAPAAAVDAVGWGPLDDAAVAHQSTTVAMPSTGALRSSPPPIHAAGGPFGAYVKSEASGAQPDADDDMDAEEAEARRAKEAQEEAKRIEASVVTLYPDLAAELHTSKIADSVMRQRAVVANRKSTAQTIQAVHNMCAEVVEVMQLDDTLDYALRRQLDTGEGNFTKLADHIQTSMRKRRSMVQVVENTKIEALESEALRAASLEEQLAGAVRALTSATEEFEAERIAWDEERAQLLLRPPVDDASPSDESFLPTPIPQHRSSLLGTNTADGTSLIDTSSRFDLEANRNAAPTVQQPSVATTALEDLSNLRQSHKYQVALDRSAQVSAMIVACMKRLASELSPAERTALTYELVGESVVTLHKTLVPLFSTQLFRRLHVLSHVPLPPDPLEPFQQTLPPTETDDSMGSPATGRRKGSSVALPPAPPRKLLPNVAQLLDFDFRIVSGVYEVLRADSASVVAKLKNTFEHARTRVMLRKAQQQSEKRLAAAPAASPQSLAVRQTDGASYQAQREAAFLQKREAALAQEVERLERQREKIEEQRSRQASEALGGRWWAARAQPLPMHPVLLFLTEHDFNTANEPGGLVAGATDASVEYMEEFRARIGKWFAHSHSSIIQPHHHRQHGVEGDSTNASTWGSGTLRTVATAASSAVGEGSDGASRGGDKREVVESEDAWKYRTPENYVQKLIPVKAVDLQVDRELGRRRLLAGHTLVKAPSKHIYGAGAGTTVKNIVLQQLQQRVMERVAPPTALSTVGDVCDTPPPHHHQAAAGSPVPSPTTTPPPGVSGSIRSLTRPPMLPPLAASHPSSSSSPASPAYQSSRSQQLNATASPVVVESPSMPRSTTFSSGRASLSTPPPGPWDHHAYGASSLVPTLGSTIASSSASLFGAGATSSTRRLPMRQAPRPG